MGKNTQSIVGIIKLIVFVLLIPVLVAVIKAFLSELSSLISSHYQAFLNGSLALVILHLFILTPAALYQSGQKVFADIFSLFPRFASMITLIVPFLASLLLIILYLCTNIFKLSGLEGPFLFFAGFFFAFHIILTAQDMSDEDSTFLKPNYYFGITWVIICNIVVVASLLALNFDRFEFLSFYETSVRNVADLLLGFPRNILSIIP